MSSQNPISLQHLNQCAPAEFVQYLGGVFEHSPWVAQAVLPQRPFASVADLHAAMAAAVRTADAAAHLRLIRAHPELAGKAAIRGELTAESTREQSGAGLDQCSPQEFAELQRLNAEYTKKFGFPFIIAVRGHDRQSIIRHFTQRLAAEPAAEMQECIEQIVRIGGFRLADLVADGTPDN
ncbi:2-oxo-4-hydroxy-4-carboxy-5-ureidoimidazoline decarboxylase [Undibacterium griseum]|uniref:2-oxo-4-hydroxy-4-carboxy-5-ureidoimidazoline decarboxylase n=1 Tax=Undibacterium griseum TaxID=2762295 RepID=A0ABR6YII6_9BURK|nr:2-oxo-4-hydroxy-4-carboxy-5-ureidoimidazoline decarboxylase [Undibacterium griseum]MBC3883721.1 2-oxo-4-hydroxy-4-carboxy-5-ureidoimidazoline decarboxylase [Undibacterium griseum]